MKKIDIAKMEKHFSLLQEALIKKITLANRIPIEKIKIVSGIDLAYWEENDCDYAVCCIVSID